MTINRQLGRLQHGDVLTDMPILGVVESVHPLPVSNTVTVRFLGGMTLTGYAGEILRVEPEHAGHDHE